MPDTISPNPVSHWLPLSLTGSPAAVATGRLQELPRLHRAVWPKPLATTALPPRPPAVSYHWLLILQSAGQQRRMKIFRTTRLSNTKVFVRIINPGKTFFFAKRFTRVAIKKACRRRLEPSESMVNIEAKSAQCLRRDRLEHGIQNRARYLDAGLSRSCLIPKRLLYSAQASGYYLYDFG